MTSINPHFLASVTFAAYFLFRLLTVNPFLPRSTSPGYALLLQLLLVLASYVPPCLIANFSALSIPFYVSWVVASLTAIRFAYDPLFQNIVNIPIWLNLPCALLWRADILVYFLFSIWTLAASRSLSLVSFLLVASMTIIASTIYLFGVSLRVHAQGHPVTLRTIVGSLFSGPSPQIQTTESAPPTVYEASAYHLLFFRWAFPIIQTGFRRSLDFPDVPSLSDRYSSHNLLYNRFLPAWDHQQSKQNPSVLKALLQTFGLRLLLSGIIKLFNDICIFTAPLLLRAVSLSNQIHKKFARPSF